MKRKAAVKNWHDLIATKLDADHSEIETVLARHRIEPMPVAASPTHLRIARLRFTGTKTIDCEELPVDFDWDELQPGLWAILSEINLRGKSTIVEVIRGCLRGALSKTLQDDANRWFKRVEMDFYIDDRLFNLSVNRFESTTGQLSRVTSNGVLRKVHAFEDEDEFEAAMSSFFMKQFSFDQFAVSHKNNESTTTVLHGWPAMCSAFFIRTDYSTIIGELPSTSGVPVRLLQLFLGIPWATTLASTSSALKEEVRRETVAGQKANEARELVQGRLDELKAELAEKKTQLEKTVVSKKLQSDMASCQKLIQSAIQRESELRTALRSANSDLENAKAMESDDRLELLRHEEGSSAEAVFRSLDPKACPRCETTISSIKKKLEHSTNECAVCGGSVHADVDVAQVKNALKARLKASQKGKRAAAKRVKDLNNELSAIRDKIAKATTKQQSLTQRLSKPSKRTSLLTDVARLEARIDEISKTIPTEASIVTDASVLKVIEAVTRKLMKKHQDRLLELISEKILEFGNRFGILQLESANLDGSLSLRVQKGGQPSSYSRLTPGEKLRLKVATILAMIHVGQEEGIGRYPGLLILDSPAAQEVTESDLAEVMSGVAEIAKSIPHLQIFVASRSAPAITDYVPPARRREVTGEEYLW